MNRNWCLHFLVDNFFMSIIILNILHHKKIISEILQVNNFRSLFFFWKAQFYYDSISFFYLFYKHFVLIFVHLEFSRTFKYLIDYIMKTNVYRKKSHYALYDSQNRSGNFYAIRTHSDNKARTFRKHNLVLQTQPDTQRPILLVMLQNPWGLFFLFETGLHYLRLWKSCS